MHDAHATGHALVHGVVDVTALEVRARPRDQPHDIEGDVAVADDDHPPTE